MRGAERSTAAGSKQRQVYHVQLPLVPKTPKLSVIYRSDTLYPVVPYDLPIISYLCLLYNLIISRDRPETRTVTRGILQSSFTIQKAVAHPRNLRSIYVLSSTN